MEHRLTFTLPAGRGGWVPLSAAAGMYCHRTALVTRYIYNVKVLVVPHYLRIAFFCFFLFTFPLRSLFFCEAYYQPTNQTSASATDNRVCLNAYR